MLELFAKTFDPTDFYTALTPTQRGVVLPSSLIVPTLLFQMCGACWKCKRYSPILVGIMK